MRKKNLMMRKRNKAKAMTGLNKGGCQRPLGQGRGGVGDAALERFLTKGKISA
jgi:hypothetical protein